MPLTKPQEELLDKLREDGQCYCVRSYKPAQKLVDLGLAEWSPRRFGSEMLVLVKE